MYNNSFLVWKEIAYQAGYSSVRVCVRVMIDYQPPTKLREGNIFTRVCLSVHWGGPHETITYDTLDLTVHA